MARGWWRCSLTIARIFFYDFSTFWRCLRNTLKKYYSMQFLSVIFFLECNFLFFYFFSFVKTWVKYRGGWYQIYFIKIIIIIVWNWSLNTGSGRWRCIHYLSFKTFKKNFSFSIKDSLTITCTQLNSTTELEHTHKKKLQIS